MVAGAGMKLIVLICSCHSWLTVGKFSHGGWSWNEVDGVDLLLPVCKFTHGGWSWNEADGVDLLLAFLA
jgi:hypothetical protein